MNQSVFYLEFFDISKVFPGVKAPKNASFLCQEGTMHALMRETVPAGPSSSGSSPRTG
ncbi:hypothetical protein [Aeromonas sp. MdU4]|uniref:hypothetical protein n=1 Tax=Aeromonas sp. MdU4 TaxID=3342819 RepID=UPI0035BA5E7F